MTAKRKPSKPTIAERAAQNICPNCGDIPQRRSVKGPSPTFCTKECKIAHFNRHVVEGRAIIVLLKAWRVDRGSGEIASESLSQVCTILDGFNAADLAAGRPRSDLIAAKILVTKTTYFDRQKK